MTNEELAVKIKAGETALYAVLWEQTEPLIRRMAQRYLTFHAPAGVEFDDLVQTAFFALVDAVRYYTPSKGWKLTTYLSCTAKRAFADVCGFRSGRSDAMHRAESIDEPLGSAGDEESDITLMDTLADENALEDLESVSERAFQEQLSRVLRLALSELEPAERTFLTHRFFMNEQRQDAERHIVEQYAIPAESVHSYTARIFPKLRGGSYRRQLRELLDELIGESSAIIGTGGGLGSFNRTGYSATESAAFERIARENRKK